MKQDYENTKWWKEHQKFVQDIKDKKIPFFQNDGKPLKEWKLFETWGVARDAAWGASRGAAWNAAWDAAWKAAWNAAWKAAWNAAGNAAGDAAVDAAWKAARDAAGDAAGDAALYTRVFHVCFGLKLESKHKIHVKKRWQVWQKGYGLLCDVNGVLYVYKKVK